MRTTRKITKQQREAKAKAGFRRAVARFQLASKMVEAAEARLNDLVVERREAGHAVDQARTELLNATLGKVS